MPRRVKHRHDAAPTDRHELFQSGTTMMSVHFTEAPTAETRAVFQELADKIASGEIKMPDFPQPHGRILSVRKSGDCE